MIVTQLIPNNYKRSNTTCLKIGYIRVSTQGQNTARQKKALKQVGCTVFYGDKLSDAIIERSQLQRMLHLKKGDTIG